MKIAIFPGPFCDVLVGKLAEPDDVGQRRSQLVGYVADELVLEPVGGNQRLGVPGSGRRPSDGDAVEAPVVVAVPYGVTTVNTPVPDAPLGMVARMMMGAQSAFEPVKPRFGVRIADATSASSSRPTPRAARSWCRSSC